MVRIGIDYEVTRSVYEEFLVTKEDYQRIKEGELPEEIVQRLEDMVDDGKGNRNDDWQATDLERNIVINEWRDW